MSRKSAPVYVTSHGRQYHDPSRHYMTGSAKVITTARRARVEGYEPCAYCFGPPGRRPAVGRDASTAFRTIARESRR